MKIHGESPWARPGLAALLGSTIIVASLISIGAPAFALDFHVDAATGDDARSALEAQSPTTPWATINHALSAVDTSLERHTIRVQAGTYSETAASSFDNVALRAMGGVVTIIPPGLDSGLDIQHANILIEGITIEGGTHGIRAENADGLVIRRCTSVGASSDGFHVEITAGITIENSRTISAGRSGMLLKHSSLAYLRNNLSYDNGEWGINFENSNPGDPQPPLSTGNVVAFNTVAFNGAAGGGGVRLKNAVGDVRDNAITNNTGAGLRIDTPGASVQNILLSANTGLPVSPEDYALGGGMLAGAPLYVDPAGSDTTLGGVATFADDVFALAPSSPAVDAGTGAVGDRDIDGSTRQDLAADTGTADLGFHTGASNSGGPPAVPVGPATYHVDDDIGLDARTSIEAQDANTPWKTIGKALGPQGAKANDTVLVAAGIYPESVSTPAGPISILGSGSVELTPDPGDIGIEVSHPGVLLDGLDVTGGLHGIRGTGADGLVVRDCETTGQSANGVMIVDTTGATIESSRADGAGGRGIYLQRSSQIYVRNNLVTDSDDWGIHFDAAGATTATDNVVAFNTVSGNGLIAVGSGGVRFENATGEIRDNIIANNTGRGVKTNTAGSTVHHNDVFGSATDYDSETGTEPIFWSNLAVDPAFVGAADYRLTAVSPAIDTGSGDVANVDISGSATESGVADSAVADLGFHPNAGTSTGAPPLAPGPPPVLPGEGAVHYVDCATGSDTATKLQAQVPGTPWATIGHAVDELGFGEVIEVADGICNEPATVEIDQDGVALRGQSALGTTVTAPTGQNTFNVQADDVTLEGFLIETDHRGVLVAPGGGGPDLHRVVLRGLQVKAPLAGSIASDAIFVRDTVDGVIENCRIQDSLSRALHLRRIQNAYVRNNLVQGSTDYGIHLDDELGSGSCDGNVIAFNTVTGNGNGIRFQTCTGEVRDNLVISNSGTGVKTDTAPVYVHHNDIFDNPTRFDTLGGQEPAVWDNLTALPRFTGTFQLSESALAQGEDSPAIGAGSGLVGSVDISGSTRTDDVADDGTANLGYHWGAGASTGRPAIQPPPGGPGPYTYYVDDGTGDDTRSRYDARDPTTPWQTIKRALEPDGAASDDTVSIAAGIYTDTSESNAPNVTLIASGAVTVTPAPGKVGLRINHAGFAVVGLAFQGGLHGLRATNADGLLVQNCSFSGQTANAIRTVTTSGVVIDSNTTHNANGTAILLDETDTAYVRNNLVVGAGEWGIHLANGSGPAVAANNIVAFNTVYGAGRLSQSGAIRLQKATGEVRDNILSTNDDRAVKTDTAPVYAHHNVLFANAIPFESANGQEPTLWANPIADPQFIDAPGGDFALRQVPVEPLPTSPAVDTGSALVIAADISGSTRTDAAIDTGVADVGWHDAASASTGAPPPATDVVPEPGSGSSFYIDPVSGLNAHTYSEAQSPGSAWETISYALTQASPGDVIRLLPGVYEEQVDITKDALTIVGDGALGDAVLLPPTIEVGITVQNALETRIENLVIQGGSQGIRAEAADGIRITGVVVAAPSTDGIHFVDTLGGFIDSCRVSGAGGTGLKLETSSILYVRNNLVYANGEWGISIDHTTGAGISFANVVAFNTVHQNHDGIRLLEASGEVRDNTITGHVDLGLFLGGPFIIAHHNNFATNTRDRDRDAAYSSLISGWSVLGKNPRYVDPAGADGILGGLGWEDDDFHLKRLAAGESHESPMIDAGSDVVGLLDIGGTTATTQEGDAGTADVGFHYGAPAAVVAPAWAPTPGTVATTYYVSSSLGDDTRSDVEATNRSTPWETVQYAVSRANQSDTIVMLPGEYLGEVSVNVDGLTLQADEPGTAYFLPAAHTAIVVSATDVTLDGLVVRGGTTGIANSTGGDDLRVTNCAVADQSTDGIRITDASGVTVENSITTGALFSGVLLRRVTDATVKNVLSYANGEWGVSLDNTPGTEPLSTGNLVAHNTLTLNGVGNGRLLNAIGTVRDNLLTDSAGTGLRVDTSGAVLLHNGFNANGASLVPESYLFCAGCVANETIVPEYVNPAGTDGILGGAHWEEDDFRLSQIAAGQAQESAAVGFGSDLGSALGIDGSTATTGTLDSGMVDLGYHYDSSLSALPSPGYTALPLDVFYVNAATGDDGRSRAEANSDLKPWQTLSHALGELVPGDTLLVAEGTYPEAVQVDVRDVTIRGSGAAATTILEPNGPILTLTRRDQRRDGIRVRATGVSIENLWIRGARRGIASQGTPDGLSIEDVLVTGSDRDGIAVGNANGMSLSGVMVTGSRRYGVYVRKATGFQMRDSDVYANDRGGLALSRTDAEITFVTIYGNRDGVRSTRSTITFRDSIVAGNTRHGFRARAGDPVTLDYTLFGLNGRADVSPTSLGLGTGVQLDTDPMFVDAAAGDLDLQLSSTAIDAGSDLASNLGVTGSATGGAMDNETADLGAHR